MRFELKVVIGFLAALALILTLGIYAYRNNSEQLMASRWVAHTNEVLYRSEQLLSTVYALEAAKQGYALSGKESYLESYRACKEKIPVRLQRLKKLTHDNRSQHLRIIDLDVLIQKKLAFCEQVIASRKTAPAESARLVSTLYGKELTERIKELFHELTKEEKLLLEQRRQQTEEQSSKFIVVFGMASGITVAIILALFYLIYHNLKARIKAEHQLQAALSNVQDLYDNAPCGYHSLDAQGLFIDVNHTLLEWLGYAKEELIGKKSFRDILSPASIEKFETNFPLFKQQGFVSNLEFELVRKNGSSFPVLLSSSAIYDQQGQYLRSRSTTFDYTEQKRANDKIHTLNQELEAFTYTVSHDLRSPLRSISGYTKILQEDYRAGLDSEGQRLMDVVLKNTTRMGQLIDDLLNFSQIGRKELSHSLIDVEALVRTLAREAAEQSPRPLDIQVLTLAPCRGDYNMLRQVWENLIGNAIKYSQKKPDVHITIGSSSTPAEVCYYVKDNGAGFDMQFVHKLFGVFQRLHRQNEFEGTGVGLAIVKRVVTRHGGRVWAEGAPDQGATFYFCIPN